MKSVDLLLSLRKERGRLTVDELSKQMSYSRQYIHKLLDRLLDEEKIEKIGRAPIVYYHLKFKNNAEPLAIKVEEEEFLNKHFVLVTATGELLQGLPAIQHWCLLQQLPLLTTIEEFISTRKKYLALMENNLLDGLPKIINTKQMGTIGIDALFYLDFYAIERFGKTRLGTLMHYAKQGQNKQLMKLIVQEIKNRLHYFIKQTEIDAILYVPPTIKRQVQIMGYLQKHLAIELPTIKINKIKNQIVVPQKALSKLVERVANADKTFIVKEQVAYKHILILDDAVGSGATINEIAKKVKEKKLANKITGLAITGSYKGFDVISEL
jgi:phosphoribosylpyrophosphate synthetase